MRAKVHGDAVRVRLNPALRQRAFIAAAREGVTVSELIRGALRNELREAA